MKQFFLARQPILDRTQSLCAFELLFRPRDKATEAGLLDDTYASANVIQNVFGSLGMANVLGAYKGFINVNAEFLFGDMVELLPRDQVVLELLETIVINDELVERCRNLKAMGFSLALDDVYKLSEYNKPLLSIVDVIKLDLMLIDPVKLPLLIKELKQYPVKLLAEKVEEREQAEFCMELGFDLFQGYYFSRPEMLSGRRSDPSKMLLLRILTMMQGDAENEEIVNAFKEHPVLSYDLLRMVNSASNSFSIKVSSLSQGLMILGRKVLQRWIQLLMYASAKETGARNPLLQLAATRAKLMELIAEQVRQSDPDYADSAFMVGMLSLIEVIMDTPMYDIVTSMGLDEEMSAALLERRGDLGDLLSLCGELESCDAAAVQMRLCLYPSLGVDLLNGAHLQALAWANNIAT